MGDRSPDIFDTEEECGRNEEYEEKEEDEENSEEEQEEEEEKSSSSEDERELEYDEPDYDPWSPLRKEVRSIEEPYMKQVQRLWTRVKTKLLPRMLLSIPCYL